MALLLSHQCMLLPLLPLKKSPAMILSSFVRVASIQRRAAERLAPSLCMRLLRLCHSTASLIFCHNFSPKLSSRSLTQRLLSSIPHPQPLPVPFVDNVATLFNASALSSKERPLRATIIHTNGSTEQRDLDRRTLKMETGLAGRDLRVIDGELNRC
jgi:hypothetical protein